MIHDTLGGSLGALDLFDDLQFILFFILLMITFGVWYWRLKSVEYKTAPDDVTYEYHFWATAFITACLGPTSGDLLTEELSFGYGQGCGLIGGILIIISTCYYLKVIPKQIQTATFWLSFVLSDMMGGMIADAWASAYQASDDADKSNIGGANLMNPGYTGLVFLGFWLVIVIFVKVTKYDVTKEDVLLEQNSIIQMS